MRRTLAGRIEEMLDVMTGKLKTAVLGATGYSGLELTRILLRHPRLEKPVLLRRASDNGGPADLADVFPALVRKRRLSVALAVVASAEAAGSRVAVSGDAA